MQQTGFIFIFYFFFVYDVILWYISQPIVALPCLFLIFSYFCGEDNFVNNTISLYSINF